MPISNIKECNIINALKYIDEHGVPLQNKSTKYDLITDDGKKYPPKYVIAVARHLETGEEIETSDFTAVEAKNFLQRRGYSIETKQEKFELTISADNVISTDERFTMDNLALGDYYKPLSALFKKANGKEIKRNYSKGERRISNQTMPRIACQVFEKQLVALSIESKENFPICKYNPSSEMIRGIYTSIDQFRKHYNTIEYLIYNYGNGNQFVFYCWNIFSTIIFIQECLKQFGEPGDQMILTYREKDEQEVQEDTTTTQKEVIQPIKGYQNPFSAMLIESKNIIFHGAPGTGKSYLAKEIATDIISNGYYNKYTQLSDEQKKQVEFVQFHPNYDYSDFVEGLRPKVNYDGTIGFELQDGIFKKFIYRAKKNYEDSNKSNKIVENELIVEKSMIDFFNSVNFCTDIFNTINGNDFTITNIEYNNINISIHCNENINRLSLSIDDIRKMLECDIEFTNIKDVADFFGKKFTTQAYAYYLAIYNAIKTKKITSSNTKFKTTELKKYIFIIDEINRGEISKIFGELFFSIDPGYRGRAGEISTQYSNMHSDPDEKFYIPENVYIIGTMNDIDRSVDSFDFAMRRRFRFVNLKADERLEMLASLKDDLQAEAIRRMTALNKEIATVEGLNENYQIGVAYFLKLHILNFDQLWTDYLQPLLQEYVHGMYDEDNIMNRFAKAYGYKSSLDGDADEVAKD